MIRSIQIKRTQALPRLFQHGPNFRQRITPITKFIMAESIPLNEPADVLYRIKRGLSGYISYLAACEMNESFSEYVLYEPILRILTARGFSVACEYICPGIRQPVRGDKKKIDFYAKKDAATLAIEVKWIRSPRLSIVSDVQKLNAVKRIHPETIAVLCIFGRQSDVSGFVPTEPRLQERGKSIVADFGKTRYACRIYELKVEDE